MNRGFGGRCAAIVAAAMLFAGAAHAESSAEYPQEVEEIEESPTVNDSSWADRWWSKPGDDGGNVSSGEDADGAKYGQGKTERKERFVWLLQDENYHYFLDKQSVKWRLVPYMNSEYMVDAWIRLLPIRQEQTETEYDDEGNALPSRRTYYLEHYYIRPKTRQIQFLCELEVTGRPQNTISQREYDYKNWEDLIPGSIEDEIYRSVLKVTGKSRADSKGHMGFFDMLDEYARIGMK